MNKLITMGFYEGGEGALTSIIGTKEHFKSKEEFLNYCITKDDDLYIEFDCNREEGTEMNFTLDDIEENYVKYYEEMPAGFSIEEGYTFCNKDEEGAFEVYVLKVN